MSVMKAVWGGVLCASLLVTPAFGQSSGDWNGLPDRFQIDTGYFRLGADTKLRYDGTEDIDFEKDLGVAEDVNTFWVDGTWRVGRRHQLKLGYTGLSRDRDGVELQREIIWGGETYQAGLRASTSTAADILGGYYRFALVRNERFELGPAVGIGYLWLSARLQATGTVDGQSRTLDESATKGSVTGAVGGYANGWLTKRLVARADFLYIRVSPGDSEASVSDWRFGADYYFFKNAGLGVQYKYNRYSYDRGILVSELGGEVTYEGFQVFLSFLF
jgi:predicted porin